MPATSSHASVPARVGLVGNPSDGFAGAVLATVVPTLEATVAVNRSARGLRVRNPSSGSAWWPSWSDLTTEIATVGHRTDHRLVTAALDSVSRHLDHPVPPLDIEWTSTIPRSVGLGGSSAIVVAVIEAVADVLGAVLDPRVVAALALDAEVRQLGIAAGWQDRVVQSHRGTVLVDVATMATVDGLEVPTVRRLSPPSFDLVVGWRLDDAEHSGDYHADLRRRAEGDELAAAMAHLASLARHAARCVEHADRAGLAAAVEASWSVRRRSMPLRDAHVELVEAVRATGTAATSPGSGGSVVACPIDDEAAERTIAALTAVGAEFLLVRGASATDDEVS